MRVEDAPPAGWYPDPSGTSRLRWWEGTDWSDQWRAPPTPGVVEIRREYELEHGMRELDASDEAPWSPHAPTVQYGGMSRADSEALVQQIRVAARQEVERAAGAFGREARSAADSIGPLITTYTSKLMRWVRLLSTVAVIIFVAWLAFQIFAQASLFEWIGDRIDNLTDENGLGVTAGVRPHL
jgi:hypothetical protein